MALNLSKFQKKRSVSFKRGDVKVEIGDILTDEIVTVTTYDGTEWVDTKGCIFSIDLVNELQQALDNEEFKSIIVKAR